MIRILYAGSPEPAAKTLKILIEKSSAAGFEVAGVLTNPPSAKGRHKELIPTPVAQVASELSTEDKPIPVFTPAHLDGDARDLISPLKCDVLVCFAYGHIFGPKFLAMFPMGGMNLHPSLLPKYRGCTPVPAAILNRDTETAFTVQTLSLGMDEGLILSQEKISLTGTETGGSLLDAAAERGAELIVELLREASSTGKLKEGIPQEGEPSYTGIITKEDGKLDWNQSALSLDAKIRAYCPEPGTFCGFTNSGKEENLRVLEAVVLESPCTPETAENAKPGTVLAFDKPSGIWIKTGDGILCVKKLQKQGKNVMSYKDFMNGTRDFIGTLLK